jgi:sugar transferase (PEP-CTERM/EpsH1 system associated)
MTSLRAKLERAKATASDNVSKDHRGGARASEQHVPLVAHIIYRLDVGGLENGLVNIINRTSRDRYRHAIICLTTYSNFYRRIYRKDVSVFALNKQEGKDLKTYVKLWHLLRRLRADIIHTRNLPALDSVFVGVLAGVPYRIHSEHGRDMLELDGDNRKYNLLRRVCRPFVHKYVPLSRDLAYWLEHKIGVPPEKIAQIYNGVDTSRFHPPRSGRAPLPLADFALPGTIIVGGVGRLARVKDPMTLVRAFVHLLASIPNGRDRLRLVLVGDGPLRDEIEQLVQDAEVTDITWLAGNRNDVPQLLRAMDIFVLPSLAEGISNTVLEAMASALPVVATRVGGTPELVTEGVTGMMVPTADPVAMAERLKTYVENPELRTDHGRAGRKRVKENFSLEIMVERYLSVYDSLLTSTGAG